VTPATSSADRMKHERDARSREDVMHRTPRREDTRGVRELLRLVALAIAAA
jgi:hypothetical protein